MAIVSKNQLEKLIENGKKKKENDDVSIPPVVLLRLPNKQPSAWMLAFVEPNNHDMAFGLMQISDGFPELGYVSLKELEDLHGYNNKSVYHDPLFKNADPLDIHRYARMAKDYGQITLRFTERVTKDDLLKFKKEK